MAAGFSFSAEHNSDTVVWRYTAGGKFDQTFGSKVTFSTTPLPAAVTAAVLKT